MSNLFPSEIVKLNGPLFLEKLDENDLPTGGLFPIGDISKLQVMHEQKFDDVRESQSGLNSIIAHIPITTDMKATFTAMSWSAANLATFLYGNAEGAEVAGTVSAEALNAYPSGYCVLAKQNVSSVVLTHAATPLVLGTDYTVDARTGLVTFLAGSSVITGSGPISVSAAYSYAANGGAIEPLLNSVPAYRLVFLGINVNGGKPHRVEIHKMLLDLPKTLDFIADKHAELDMTGMVLPNANQPSGTSPWWKITKG